MTKPEHVQNGHHEYFWRTIRDIIEEEMKKEVEIG
jgi:hypothetical protein